MSRLKDFIHEIHRRSLWQVLLVNASGGRIEPSKLVAQAEWRDKAMKKLIVLAGALLVAVACSEQQQAPTEVQFGKGGKARPEITEYWITGGNMLHIAGTGSVAAISPRVAYDFWPNGERDDNYSDHFEVAFPGPGGVEVVQNGRSWYADIPWNGERQGEDLFRDQGDPGPDHFVFSFPYKQGNQATCCLTPRGVVGPAPVGAKSYATFDGDPPVGTVGVSSLSLTGVTCEIVTTGRGKKKSASKTLVSATVTPVMTEDQPSYWMEFHFMIDGQLMEREPRHTYSATPVELITLLDGVRTTVDVGMVFDYVVPLNALVDHGWDGIVMTADAGEITCN
jgi:hypothetical protein